MNQGPKCKTQDNKALRNIGQKFHCTALYSIWHNFLDITSKAQVTKNRWIRLHENFKNLCILRYYPQSKKATCEMGENTDIHHISAKGLISRIYREL